MKNDVSLELFFERISIKYYHIKDSQRKHEGVKISLASSIPGKDDDCRDVADESDDADDDNQHALDVKCPTHLQSLKRKKSC